MWFGLGFLGWGRRAVRNCHLVPRGQGLAREHGPSDTTARPLSSAGRTLSRDLKANESLIYLHCSVSSVQYPHVCTSCLELMCTFPGRSLSLRQPCQHSNDDVTTNSGFPSQEQLLVGLHSARGSRALFQGPVSVPRLRSSTRDAHGKQGVPQALVMERALFCKGRKMRTEMV